MSRWPRAWTATATRPMTLPRPSGKMLPKACGCTFLGPPPRLPDQTMVLDFHPDLHFRNHAAAGLAPIPQRHHGPRRGHPGLPAGRSEGRESEQRTDDPTVDPDEFHQQGPQARRRRRRPADEPQQVLPGPDQGPPGAPQGQPSGKVRRVNSTSTGC